MVQIHPQQPLTEHAPSSPHVGVLHSSEALGWPGIVVEQRYHPGGEYSFSYPSFHMICLHQDRPMPVEQVRHGRTFPPSATGSPEFGREKTGERDHVTSPMQFRTHHLR